MPNIYSKQTSQFAAQCLKHHTKSGRPGASQSYACQKTSRKGWLIPIFLKDRLALYPALPPKKGPWRFWLHGASGGDLVTLVPLAKSLKAEARPGLHRQLAVCKTLALGWPGPWVTSRIPTPKKK